MPIFIQPGEVISCQRCGKPSPLPFVPYTVYQPWGWIVHNWCCRHGTTYECAECYTANGCERCLSCPVCGRGDEYT